MGLVSGVRPIGLEKARVMAKRQMSAFGNLQGSQHVTGRDAVNSNTSMSPLDGQRSSKMSNGCFRNIVWTVAMG